MPRYLHEKQCDVMLRRLILLGGVAAIVPCTNNHFVTPGRTLLVRPTGVREKWRRVIPVLGSRVVCPVFEDDLGDRAQTPSSSVRRATAADRGNDLSYCFGGFSCGVLRSRFDSIDQPVWQWSQPNKSICRPNLQLTESW
jgi:hypothetical protein